MHYIGIRVPFDKRSLKVGELSQLIHTLIRPIDLFLLLTWSDHVLLQFFYGDGSLSNSVWCLWDKLTWGKQERYISWILLIPLNLIFMYLLSRCRTSPKQPGANSQSDCLQETQTSFKAVRHVNHSPGYLSQSFFCGRGEMTEVRWVTRQVSHYNHPAQNKTVNTSLLKTNYQSHVFSGRETSGNNSSLSFLH